MFLILMIAALALIWTRPDGVLGITTKVTGTGVVLTVGCCLGMCTGLG